jgi:NADPH:quinone reductase-like Zn-dependent oxidoreductase
VQQIWIPRAGPTTVLELREAPDPEPGPGELRVRVEASGVNFADLMARQGTYPDAPPFPCVVGYEVAGVVDAVGEGVGEDWIGEPVACATKFGGYSDVVCVREVQVARRRGLDAVAAASLPVVGLTSWMMLMEMGRIREGDRVLVHSAGGGVGLMALDLLKWKGCTAIGTASARKHDFLRARGYDQLIDYRTDDFHAVLKGEAPLDLVLDPVGGESWAKGLDLLRPAGRLICFGVSSMAAGQTRSLGAALGMLWGTPWMQVNPIALMNKNRGVMGVNMGHMFDERERLAGWLQQILDLVEAGVVRPHVHATVPFSEATEAHRMLHDRENLGKVVLVPDGR